MSEHERAPVEVPRRSLREESFRKFEQWIAIAAQGTVKINVKAIPMKPSSFIQGFNDARRGWRLYKYNTKLIPIGYDLTMIRPVELSDGTVLLKNAYEDEQKKAQADVNYKIGAISNKDVQIPDKIQVPTEKIWFDNKDGLDAVIATINEDREYMEKTLIFICCKSSEEFTQATEFLRIAFIGNSVNVYPDRSTLEISLS